MNDDQQNTDENNQIVESRAITPRNPNYSVIHPDIAWIEATRGLQSNLLRSLQNYKQTRGERGVLADQRKRMLGEVTEQYINYLRDEAKLASKAALEARDSMLRQELAKLRSELFTELAGIVGSAVVEIEQIHNTYASKLSNPAFKEAYEKFVMGRILTLLEQSS